MLVGKARDTAQKGAQLLPFAAFDYLIGLLVVPEGIFAESI